MERAAGGAQASSSRESLRRAAASVETAMKYSRPSNATGTPATSE